MRGTLYTFASRLCWSLVCVLVLAPPASGEIPGEKGAPYTLAELLEIAEERNPTLAAFLANLAVSQGEAATAVAYPNPTVNVLGGHGESRGLSPQMSRDEYQASVVQPLEWPLKRESRILAARERVEAARLDAEGFRLFLRAEVKEAFYRVLLAEQQVELAMRNLETVEELHRSVEVRVQTGEAPAFELVKSGVEKLKAQKEVTRFQSQVELARTSLNALLGNALPQSFRLEGEFVAPKELSALDRLVESALSVHPSVSRHLREVGRWRYQLTYELQARVPDVGVGGLYVRELDKESFGAVLSVPLPFWDRRRGQIATAMAEGRRAEAELQRARADLTKAVAREYQNYQIAAEQLRVFETGLLKQAEEALRIAQISFRQGASGLLDLLDAQRVQRATLHEYYVALYDLSVADAQLERVTGRAEF